MSELLEPSITRMATRALTVVMLAGGMLLATAPGTWAQQAPANVGSAPTKATHPRQRNPIEQVEVRITKLHGELKITPAQEPAWNNFAQVMRDNAKDMKALLDQRAQRLNKMTAVSELESHAQMAEAYAVGLRKVVTSFETFYSTMPDDQKKIADKVMTYREGRRKHRGK